MYGGSRKCVWKKIDEFNPPCQKHSSINTNKIIPKVAMPKVAMPKVAMPKVAMPNAAMPKAVKTKAVKTKAMPKAKTTPVRDVVVKSPEEIAAELALQHTLLAKALAKALRRDAFLENKKAGGDYTRVKIMWQRESADNDS